jgi:glycerate kinase
VSGGVRIVLAPDKFKGTLRAADVAASLAEGIHVIRQDAEIVTIPVSDGGDGLLEAFEVVGFERVRVIASGPTGTPVRTHYARRGTDAVIELAAIAGLAQLERPAPTSATSRGVGEVIAAALDAGCTRVVLGIGGSASTDGGAGMVQALGARIRDDSGDEVAAGGAGLRSVAELDLHGLHPALNDAAVQVACDVDNPLTGPFGAAAVYGPQKGADPDHVAELDAALGRWADVVAAATGADHRDEPGAGAAGGVGFAAVALLAASLRPGAELVLELAEFAGALAGADVVVTGEGALDEQTLHGKAPAGVAAAAMRAGVPAVAVTGSCLLEPAALAAAGFAEVHTLLAEAGGADPAAEAMSNPGPLLRRVGERIARGLPS